MISCFWSSGSADTEGKEHLLACGSAMLRGAELKDASTQESFSAVVQWLQHFRHYLYGVPFILNYITALSSG